MDYDSLCNEILKINSKVRYSGVYNTQTGKVYEKMQKGIERYLNADQTRDSLVHGFMRWKNRQHLSELIGDPICAMAKYPKLNRLTMPCGKNALLMVSTESELEPYTILDDINKLIEKFADDPNYSPRVKQLNF